MLRDVNRAEPKIAEHYLERFIWDDIHDPLDHEGQVLVRVFGGFCKKHRSPSGVAALTKAGVIEGIVTLLTRGIICDGVVAGSVTCLRTSLSGDSGGFVVLLEAILRSCLKRAVPPKATDLASWKTFLLWRWADRLNVAI